MRSTGAGFLVAICFYASPVGQLAASETEIRDAITGYVAAFNSQDLASISKMWAENATHMDHELAERTEGRDQIVQDIAAVFERSGGVRLSGTVDHIRMVTDSVASIDGQVVVSDRESEPSASRYSAILVKQGGGWVIDSMDEMPLPRPVSAAAALSELDWLVGSWQDASGDLPVRATVRPSMGGAFLVRSFEATSADGNAIRSTQIIGWDPRSGQVRSWMFDADGSFGSGLWTRSGQQWLINATQTLADGRAASGTYVMTRQDEDSFEVQLIGREIEGEPQPASPAIAVRRADPSEVTVDASAATQP